MPKDNFIEPKYSLHYSPMLIAKLPPVRLYFETKIVLTVQGAAKNVPCEKFGNKILSRC